MCTFAGCLKLDKALTEKRLAIIRRFYSAISKPTKALERWSRAFMRASGLLPIIESFLERVYRA